MVTERKAVATIRTSHDVPPMEAVGVCEQREGPDVGVIPEAKRWVVLLDGSSVLLKGWVGKKGSR